MKHGEKSSLHEEKSAPFAWQPIKIATTVNQPPDHGIIRFTKKNETHGVLMQMSKLTMIYWKEEKFWLGKILERPEIMTQGETLEELEANLKEAYQLMIMDDVPANFGSTVL
jgi:predicted RNase H-like HicB family nuclease